VRQRGRVWRDTGIWSKWLAFLFGGFHLTRVWNFAAMCGFLAAVGRKLHGFCSQPPMRQKKKAAIGFAPMAAIKGERG